MGLCERKLSNMIYELLFNIWLFQSLFVINIFNGYYFSTHNFYFKEKYNLVFVLPSFI